MSSDRESLQEQNRRTLISLIREFEKTRGRGVALKEAARHGLPEEVTRLLDAGVDVDWCEENRVTPLMLACFAGRTKIVTILLKYEADVDATDHEGWTPIISLMGGLQREATIAAIIKLLLKAGADPSIRTIEGKTALDYTQERYGDRVCDLLRGEKS